jgi:carboxyl-terminal processing protease
MPRRNVLWLILVAAVSLACYRQVQSNRYARVFGDALDVIHTRVLSPVDRDELFNGAMQGMMKKLDKNSRYTSAEEMQKFKEDINHEFVGVGMEVTMDPKTRSLMVISPIPNTPAAKEGILAGDRILRIDNQSTDGLSLNDAVKKMRGKPGAPVVLTVLHEGQDKPVDIKITREAVHEDTVQGDRRSPDGKWDYFLEGSDRIGYLRITGFAERTPRQFATALRWLIKHDMRGLVLDLRDNAGGRLTAATDICDMLINSGIIVTIRYRNEEETETFEAEDEETFPKFPMAVLVNGLSASASEIVAACLQDHGRAIVVGQRTYGKGTVQEIIHLSGGKGLMTLTIAEYRRPNGENIHRNPKKDRDDKDKDTWGVKPNKGYEVVLDEDQTAKLRRWMRRRNREKPSQNGDAPGEDPQLARAIEYLDEKP